MTGTEELSILDLDIFTQWIGQNPQWALFIVFGIAFIESLAVIGLLMPGWLLLVGVGVLIGTGNINFYQASLFCFAGAVLGEYISFRVGVHYQEKIHHWSIFKRHPDWLAKTEHFFLRYGVASIALGRFVGPVRAFVPLLAGMSAMPTFRFQMTNLLSAMVWAPLYLIPGVIIGASVQIESTTRWILLTNIAVIVISGWLAASYLKNTWRIRHPDYKNNEYDQQHVVLKMLLALLIFLSAIIYIAIGPQQQQLEQLLSLFWQIINQ